ncbi:glycine--tRNA ligase [Acidimicrobiaceae bacterium]|jgi:glycyl-tRNA synthetase|nr:glycine--tRNA ligase [Acidimicrobiaceae bacterium]MBT6445078.1 glycine--tRNA ligase [Acidimicrobiaceae bacterium]MDB2392224.1 glycine--tRNA ligase [Acidimicrobiaceae bacterium]
MSENETSLVEGDLMEKIVNLSKRRGFAFQSADIYGGSRSTYDYGPIGVLLLRNIKDFWWRTMVQLRHDVVGIDAAIIGPPAVFEASGHLANFSDPLVECRECNERFRVDVLEDANVCPNCKAENSFTEAKEFNLMFKTHAGPVEGSGNEVYLRPETAQGMFTNFMNVQTTTRKKPPFGIAQIGKSFRNEITPRNFVFRTREFEQMEMEFFVPPDEAQQWYEYWRNERYQWYVDLGIPESLLMMRDHDDDELSHYSDQTADVEFKFPWGWGELEGIANRGDFDLKQHAEHSGARIEYFDQANNERYVPHVIEPAAGATRAWLAFLVAAYHEETVNDDVRTVLKLDHRLAPFQIAVLPLSKKDELIAPCEEILAMLQSHYMVDYDITQAIGKRYRRQDEIGTPLCITVDFDTLEDNAVTVRDRDTMEQVRVPIDGLLALLSERLPA